MQRTRVRSSALTSIGYSPEDEILEIEFHSGRVYQYLGVPTPEYENLIAADSLGRWFNKHIRDAYEREEVTGDESE